jgi:diaminohydroxyphosphoribosylaminopyrimidine deaminase/5-amino-6-(5-phosphoribosylamino)uracil reductase
LPGPKHNVQNQKSSAQHQKPRLRRIVLDANARLPLTAKLVTDESARLTTVVVLRAAPASRVAALEKHVHVLKAPCRNGKIDLRWLLKRLGAENVISLLVEGGGEVNASFLLQRRAQRVAFFYAPKVLGGRDSRKAVAGAGAQSRDEILDLTDVEWLRLGSDWLLSARIRD